MLIISSRKEMWLTVLLYSYFIMAILSAHTFHDNFIHEDGNHKVQGKTKADFDISDTVSLTKDLSDSELNTTVIFAEFNNNYSYDVAVHYQWLFIYQYNETNMTTALRVQAYSKPAHQEFPVMFVVRQQEGILSWQIPLFVNYIYSYSFTSRTLCPMDKNRRQNMTSQQLIYVDVSTMSKDNIKFNLSATLLDDFEIQLDKPYNVTVTPPEPQYFMFTFPEDVESVLLRVTSPDRVCTVVSVQEIKKICALNATYSCKTVTLGLPTCPVFDLDRNIGYEGKHETMTTQTALFLEKSDYANFDAFYVVIIVKPSNADCLVEDQLHVNGSTAKKELSIYITKTISQYKYIIAVFAALSLFLGFYIIAAIIGYIYHGSGCHRNFNDLTQEEQDKLLCFNYADYRTSAQGQGRADNSPMSDDTSDSDHSYLRSERTPHYGSVTRGSDLNSELQSHEMCNSVADVRTEDEDEDSNIDTSDVDFLPDADSEKDIFRTKTMLFVSDLARKSHKKLSKTFKVYHWNLMTLAIFYGLPVVQLVLTYQQALLRTGDQDMCYYNFRCAHPVKYFSAFNNVISNMGYILLGILFFFLVWRRDLLHRKLVRDHKEQEQQFGVPQHFGLLYSMGVALIMEGIMSACYHVCPSYSNFQFDTSFMYIIACLCMLKIYETRHPDVQAKAYQSYFSMAFIIFIAVIGVIYGTNIFWIFYALVHMLSSLLLSAQIYYVGRISCDRYIFKRLFLMMKHDCINRIRPMYMNRFVLLFIGNLINWAFAMFGAIKHPSDFATFLLAIFIGNLLLYSLFYIIMKLWSAERINLLTGMYIFAAALSWGFSLYFFFQRLTSWQVSPALSREKNQPCIILDFYDAHDVWHFLSAISLFLSFLILLTLDDDLVLQRRDRIRVF